MRIVYLLIVTAIIGGSPVNCHAGVINVKNFGAKGDGKTDDTKAIQNAVDAAPENIQSVIYFPKGVYILRSYKVTENYLENYFIRMHSNITFKGVGKISVIRLGSHLFDKNDRNATAQLFLGIKVQNITFSSLMIDMNGANNLVPQSAFFKNQRAIFINQGSNVTVKNITIKNCSGRNMIMLAGKGQRAIVQNSAFLNGGHYVGTAVENKNQSDFSFVYFDWDSSRAINNLVQQENIDVALGGITGGIELHGSYNYATGNKIIGCSPGLYICSTGHAIKKTTVEKNNFINCTKGVSFWVNYPMDSILIKNNYIQLTDYRDGWKDYVSSGILIPNGNTEQYAFKYANASTVKNLVITGNTIITSPVEAGSRTAGMVLHSIYNTTVSGNTISGMNFGGVIIQGSKWGSSSVMVNNNKFNDFKNNIDTLFPAGYVVVFDSYLMEVADAPGIRNIIVSDNSFTRNENKISTQPHIHKRKGQFFGAYIALPDAMQNEVQFKQNIFSDKTEILKFRSITRKQ